MCVVIIGLIVGLLSGLISGFDIDFDIDFVVVGWAAKWPDGGIRPALDTGMA